MILSRNISSIIRRSFQTTPVPMGLTLYYVEGSPPVRATQLCIRALGLDVQYEFVNLFKKENLQPEFLEKNPMHSVPVLDDNGFIIWDSHAINEYLVTVYGKDNDPLFPKDPKLRAIIHQRNHFDTGLAFPAFVGMSFRVLFAKKKDILEQSIRTTRDVYALVDKFLEKSKYIACDHITIADFSIVTTLTTLEVFVPEISNYPRVAAYIECCRTTMIDYQEANQDSLDVFKAAVQERMTRSSL
uniref:Glutathione S-transferase 1, isoform D n=1 Tax=Cacopsylla melanoneura TaxID=428564 RepID=A0A8D9EDU7_9HEMI